MDVRTYINPPRRYTRGSDWRAVERKKEKTTPKEPGGGNTRCVVACLVWRLQFKDDGALPVRSYSVIIVINNDSHTPYIIVVVIIQFN